MTEASDGDRLDLQSAADALGVHYQTAYRWVRTGKLSAVMVDGHYEINSADLADVARRRNTPKRPPAPSRARLERAADRAFDALVDGDEVTIVRLVRRLLREGAPVAEVCQTVLAPPLRRIGDRWRQGELTIWAEHRASAIVERVLGDIAPNPSGRRRGTAVVAAVAGDRHTLPTTMAAVALRDDNWRAEQLGSDVPVDELIDFCSVADVDLAVITVSNTEVAGLAATAARRLEDDGTPVLVGAPGLTLDDLLQRARTVAAPRS